MLYKSSYHDNPKNLNNLKREKDKNISPVTQIVKKILNLGKKAILKP